MPYQKDSGYFSGRMAEELKRGDQATEESAVAIHYELALRYGILAAECAAGVPQKSSLKSGMVQPTPQIILDAISAT